MALEVEKPTDTFFTTMRPSVSSTGGAPQLDIVPDETTVQYGVQDDDASTYAPPPAKSFKMDTYDRDRDDREILKYDDGAEKIESFDAFLNPRKTVKKDESDQRQDSPKRQASPVSVRSYHAPSERERSRSRGRQGWDDYRRSPSPQRNTNMVGQFAAAIPTDDVPDAMETPEELMSPMQRDHEKVRLLNEYRDLNVNYMYNSTELSMDNSLHEIRTNLFLVKDQKSRAQGRKVMKKVMTVGATLAVGATNRYELFGEGVDMNDWLKIFTHEVEVQGDYDDIIDELVSKYKQKMAMPVEIKLALMVATSFGTGVMNKKEELKVIQQMREMEKEKQERERMAREEIQNAAMAEMIRRQHQVHQIQQAQSAFARQAQQAHQQRPPLVQTEAQVPPPPPPQQAPVTINLPPTHQPQQTIDIKDILKDADQFMDESEYDQGTDVITDPTQIPLPDENGNVPEKPKKKRGRPPSKKVETQSISLPSLA